MLTCAKEGVAVRHLRNPPTRLSCVTGKGSLGGCWEVWLWREGVVKYSQGQSQWESRCTSLSMVWAMVVMTSSCRSCVIT